MPELNKTILKNSANLKAYYRFEAGALTTDSSGNGHTLTNQTAVAETTSGKYGGGASFNGSHYMYTANTTALNITGNITVGCWVYFNAVAEKGLVSKGLHGDTTFQWALRTSSTGKLAFGVDDNGSWGPAGDAVASQSYSSGQWYFVVGVYDGSTVRLYIDGKCETTTSYSSGIVSKTGNVYIGTFFDTSYLVNAVIDEVFIFSSALSADQIKELYEGRYLGELRPNQFGTTAALYHLSSTTDAGGNGFHLTNNNSVGFAAGKFGNCADFGNANTNKNLSYTGSMAASDKRAMSFWTKRYADISSGSNEFVNFAISSKNSQHGLLYEYNGGTRRLGISRHIPGVALDYSYINATLGTGWNHIVFTRDDTTLDSKLFLNGNLILTYNVSKSATAGTDFLQIGIGPNSAAFSGYIDEYHISSTIPTANQIRQIYALGVGKYY